MKGSTNSTLLPNGGGGFPIGTMIECYSDPGEDWIPCDGRIIENENLTNLPKIPESETELLSSIYISENYTRKISCDGIGKICFITSFSSPFYLYYSLNNGSSFTRTTNLTVNGYYFYKFTSCTYSGNYFIISAKGYRDSIYGDGSQDCISALLITNDFKNFTIHTLHESYDTEQGSWIMSEQYEVFDLVNICDNIFAYKYTEYSSTSNYLSLCKITNKTISLLSLENGGFNSSGDKKILKTDNDNIFYVFTNTRTSAGNYMQQVNLSEDKTSYNIRNFANMTQNNLIWNDTKILFDQEQYLSSYSNYCFSNIKTDTTSLEILNEDVTIIEDVPIIIKSNKSYIYDLNGSYIPTQYLSCYDDTSNSNRLCPIKETDNSYLYLNTYLKKLYRINLSLTKRLLPYKPNFYIKIK